MERGQLEKYEVFFKSKDTWNDNSGWTAFFHAENFAHAEEQAEPYVGEHEEIYRITKEYE